MPAGPPPPGVMERPWMRPGGPAMQGRPLPPRTLGPAARGFQRPLLRAMRQRRLGMQRFAPGLPGVADRRERLQGEPGMALRGRLGAAMSRPRLTETQRKELAEIISSAVRDRIMLMSDPDMERGTRIKRLSEIRARVREQLAKLLTPEQKETLRARRGKLVPPAAPKTPAKRKPGAPGGKRA